MGNKYELLNVDILNLSKILANKLDDEFENYRKKADINNILMDLKIEKSFRERNIIKKARAFELLQKHISLVGDKNLNLNNIFNLVNKEENNSFEYNNNLQKNIIKSFNLQNSNKKQYVDMDIYDLRSLEELKKLFKNIIRILSPDINIIQTVYDEKLLEYSKQARQYKSIKHMRFLNSIAENIASAKKRKFSKKEYLVNQLEYLENKINNYKLNYDYNDIVYNKEEKLKKDISQLRNLEEDIDELFLMSIPGEDSNVYLN